MSHHVPSHHVISCHQQSRLKLEIAEMCESILTAPEANIGKLEPLFQLCNSDPDLQVS